MRRRILTALVGVVAAAVLVYGGVLGYFYVKQRDFQYDRQGKVYTIAETTLKRAQQVSITAADGSSLLAWYAPPAGELPTILYYRGNTGSFSREYERFQAFEAAGYGFLSLDYRGFPGSPGELTEQNVLADALAAFDWLQPRAPRIVIWGRSLGSGPATYVAGQRDALALILESPFRSALAVAQTNYPWLPVGLVMLDRYPVEQWIRAVQEPVFIGHGVVDPTIGVENGKAVFALAPHAVTLWIDPQGDHNNLWEHGIFDQVRTFLAAST